jgi:hypothetical protein
MDIPAASKIMTLINLGRARREAKEIRGSHQVSGAFLYRSIMNKAKPRAIIVVPNKIINIQRFTPSPG